MKAVRQKRLHPEMSQLVRERDYSQVTKITVIDAHTGRSLYVLEQ